MDAPSNLTDSGRPIRGMGSRLAEALIVFVVMLFMFAKQQDKIDRDHGYAEDD